MKNASLELNQVYESNLLWDVLNPRDSTQIVLVHFCWLFTRGFENQFR